MAFIAIKSKAMIMSKDYGTIWFIDLKYIKITQFIDEISPEGARTWLIYYSKFIS